MADEEYNAHEDINDFFGNFGTGRISLDDAPAAESQESPLQNDQPNATSEGQQAASSETVAAPLPAPDPKDAEIAELRQKLDNSARGYQKIQSEKDKYESALRTEREAFNSRIAAIEQRLSPQQEQSYDGQINPAQFNQMIDERARAIASQIIEADPGIKAGRAITDYAKYSQDNSAELNKYGFIVEAFMDGEPDIPGETYYQKLDRAISLAKRLEVKAASQVSNMANTQTQPATNANTNVAPAGQRTAINPLPAMAAKAQQMKVETGSASSALPGQPFRPDYKRPLQEQVRHLLSSMERKNL